MRVLALVGGVKQNRGGFRGVQANLFMPSCWGTKHDRNNRNSNAHSIITVCSIWVVLTIQ